MKLLSRQFWHGRDATTNWDYDKLPTPNDTRTVSDHEPRRPCFSRHIASQVFALIGIFSFVVCMIIATLLWSHPRTAQPYIVNCGNTSEEALDNGCKFDIMSFTWSHPNCFDKELMDEFLSLRNWTWWFDDKGERAASFDDVATGKYAELLVSWEYHVAHCTFMWKKMHKAILKERPLDSYVGNLNHTLHCEKMLLDREAALADINTAIRMKFPDCPIS